MLQHMKPANFNKFQIYSVLKKYRFLALTLTLLMISPSLSYAKNCEGTAIPGWVVKAQNGENIEYSQKSKVNYICSRQHSFQGALLELVITDYPKGIVEFVSRSYEFAYRFNKTGKYTIKYDIKLQDKYGKNYTAHFIMYSEVVSDSW